tara:strand:- start:1439 stop:1645 length:207 start_codon:yes stop_codon:yes gene_type:complete
MHSCCIPSLRPDIDKQYNLTFRGQMTFALQSARELSQKERQEGKENKSFYTKRWSDPGVHAEKSADST